MLLYWEKGVCNDMKAKVFNVTKMIILAAAGLLFLLYPSKSLQVAVQLLGAGLILLGIVIGVSYLVKKEKEKKDLVSLISGGVLIVLGILDIIFRDKVLDIFPAIAGLVVAAGGVAGLVQSIREKKKGKNWKYMLTVSVTSVLLGIIMFIRGFDEETILRVLGAALLYLGAIGIVNALDEKETPAGPASADPNGTPWA